MYIWQGLYEGKQNTSIRCKLVSLMLMLGACRKPFAFPLASYLQVLGGAKETTATRPAAFNRTRPSQITLAMLNSRAATRYREQNRRRMHVAAARFVLAAWVVC